MVEIQYLGHSGFKLAFPHTSILIDPFINNSNQEPEFKTLTKIPLKEEEFKGIGLILITHEHFDHFDKKAIETIIKNNDCYIIGHESVIQELNVPKHLLCPIKLGEKISIKRIDVTAVTAHHPNSYYPLGYLIDSGKETIYHAGDTELIDEFSEIKADIALLPIGGNFTMDCVDGVKATKVMKPKVVIPMHYNTFSLIKADANEFKAKIEKSILETNTVILQPGEIFYY